MLSEGRVSLDSLAEDDGSGQNVISRTFPESREFKDVTCLAMTRDFLIYGTGRGIITMVYLPELATVCDFRHELPIISVFPNQLGTRIAFIDEQGQGFLLSPVDDRLIPVPKLPNQCHGFVWDRVDWGVLVAFGSQTFSVYHYAAHSIQGASIVPVATGLRFPSPNLSPIMLAAGTAYCQEPNGTITKVVLPTHDAIAEVEGQGERKPRALPRVLPAVVALGRLARAWDLAVLLKERDIFLALGEAALKVLDIQLATRVYRELGDAGMVMSLIKLEGLEDAHLLSGHLALIFDDHSAAQDHFLQSTRPLAALEMRRDLLHWEQALKLAKTLATEQVPLISREFAKQLEFREQYDQALQMYQKGLGDQQVSTGFPWKDDPKHDKLCRTGVSKMMIRVGEVNRGVQLALEGADRECCKACAELCESLKQLPDAARLYETAELPEKAAAIHIKVKNWGALGPLMSKISSPKLHSEYAKAKEAEGNFQDAVAAYEKANDSDSVVKLLLTPQLNNPSRAMSLVRETKSPQGALLIAQHAQEKEDWPNAIEFLVMAKRPSEGFDLAAKLDIMETYCSALKDAGTLEENKKVAIYYEGKGDALRAGEFWFSCKEYAKALRLFLQCGERAVDQAVEVVGKARSDMLTHQLIDFLMGETDGVPKDPNYIFRLYMALGNYPQAAKTAIIIARQEQELGNYRIAHGILFETHRELQQQRIRVPQELALNLQLLHSYVLVRPLTKMGDHLSGARMLLRVAKHISKFPVHVVPILTSTVIECHRAGLRASSYDYATMLMRPDYREQVQRAAHTHHTTNSLSHLPPSLPSTSRLARTTRRRSRRSCASRASALTSTSQRRCRPSTRTRALPDDPRVPVDAQPDPLLHRDRPSHCPQRLLPLPALLVPGALLCVHRAHRGGGTCPVCQQEIQVNTIQQMDEEAAGEWLHGATKKENAGRRWAAGGSRRR